MAGEAIPHEVRKRAGRKDAELSRPGISYQPRAGGPTIAEAMSEAIDRGRSKSDAWLVNLKATANYFGDFIELRYPELVHWEQIRPSHAYAYIEFQSANGVSAKTLRHYTTIITSTAKYWNNEDPDRFRLIRLTHPLLTQKRKVPKKYLSPRQLALLLQYARQSENPGVLPAVMLGGYGGLNLAEIVRLDPSSFNHQAGTLTIRESKNEFRPRTIPLLPLVRAWAPGFRTIQKVNGEPATDDTLGKAVRRVMDRISRDLRARAADCPCDAQKNALEADAAAFDNVAPRNLRTTFINFCVGALIREEAIAAYVGHRHSLVTGEHYADFNQVGYLRALVLDPLQQYLEEHSTGKVVDIASVG